MKCHTFESFVSFHSFPFTLVLAYSLNLWMVQMCDMSKHLESADNVHVRGRYV